MHDTKTYSDPETFDPFRFVATKAAEAGQEPENGRRGTTFTEASKDFPVWGLGSKAW